MKRILQRIWKDFPLLCIYWIVVCLVCGILCEVYKFFTLSARIKAVQASLETFHIKLRNVELTDRALEAQNRARINALLTSINPTQAEDGEVWITNYATTNLTNYWLETEKEIKQWEYTTTKWVGKIVVGTNSPDMPERYRNSTARILDIELGLCSDGMVVWRDVKK